MHREVPVRLGKERWETYTANAVQGAHRLLHANLKWFHFIVYTKASSSGMWLQRWLGKFGKKQAKQAKTIIDYMHKNSIIIVANYPKVHIDFQCRLV